MSLRHGLTDTIVDELCDVYLSGQTISATARKYRISQSQVKSIFKRRGIRVRPYSESEKFRYDINFFASIDTEAKAYFLGLMYADGHVKNKGNSVNIQLKMEDCPILSEMSRCIAFNKDITRTFKVKGQIYGMMLDISSETIKRDLIRWGCMPVKTFKIRLPNLPEDMMRHFLRGYFDGDGCFNIHCGRHSSNNKRAIFKVVSNTLFCLDVAQYFEKNHQRYLGVYHPSPNKNVGVYQTGNDEVIKFLYRFMYKDCSVFICRKREKFEEYFKVKHFDPYNEQIENKKRRPNRVIDKLPAQEIVDLYMRGERIANIAKIYKAGEDTISKLLKINHVIPKRGPRKTNK